MDTFFHHLQLTITTDDAPDMILAMSKLNDQMNAWSETNSHVNHFQVCLLAHIGNLAVKDAFELINKTRSTRSFVGALSSAGIYLCQRKKIQSPTSRSPLSTSRRAIHPPLTWLHLLTRRIGSSSCWQLLLPIWNNLRLATLDGKHQSQSAIFFKKQHLSSNSDPAQATVLYVCLSKLLKAFKTHVRITLTEGMFTSKRLLRQWRKN